MKLTDLILDNRCQMRCAYNPTYARQLADYLESGGMLPPLVAFREGNRGPAVLADGWHRKGAREILHQKMAEVDVRKGGLREAILHAAGCNAKSPLRPEPEDFRKAAATMLLDPEWGQWSVRQISLWTGCGRNIVGQLKEQLAESASGTECQIIADGVKVERNGTVYVQKFRDMTPARQKSAVDDESERYRQLQIKDGLYHADELIVRCRRLGLDGEAGVVGNVARVIAGLKA